MNGSFNSVCVIQDMDNVLILSSSFYPWEPEFLLETKVFTDITWKAKHPESWIWIGNICINSWGHLSIICLSVYVFTHICMYIHDIDIYLVIA